MKQADLTVKSNECLTGNVFRMVLQGDIRAVTQPGQFVNLKIDGCFLRRPISVCDINGDELTLIYKVVGEGTEKMAALRPGETIDTLVGLGNGFDTSKSGDCPVLIGGGVGVPPLYYLCKKLKEQGRQVSVILGFNRKDEVFLEEEFRALGAKVFVTTADGSYGQKGFVTDALRELSYSFFYTCGPMPMFRALAKTVTTKGQYSFEERMGCGFGACMGCSCKTLTGNKRICKEGPVMESEDILWEN